MFMLNDKPLALDVPFTQDGIQYPANWLRLASPAERAAIGITEVADPVAHDSRFYRAPGVPKLLEDREESDEQGNPLYVKVLAQVDGRPVMVDSTERLVTKGLKSQWIAQIKATAASLLAPTDWKITRAAEGVKPVDAATLAERAAIRAASDANEAAVLSCTTVDELAALQMQWPTNEGVL
jgi:hypothetical protein